MFAQKIIDRIGMDAWEKYRERAKASFARAEGVPVEKTSFDWDAAGADGPQDPMAPSVRWEAYNGDEARTRVVTEWRGHDYADVFVTVQPPSKAAEQATPQPAPDRIAGIVTDTDLLAE